jgi:hypothetical protein
LQAAASIAAWLLSFSSGANALSLGYTLPVWDW